MGSEAEAEPSSTPRLLLFSTPHAHVQSPERSGTLTPPLHTSASVPFRWEEEPGKPRGCTTLSYPIDYAQKCLELPPRLFVDATPSPTIVLEGPYMGKPRFQSSSFRIIRRRECYGSFRRSCSPDRGQFGTMVLSKRKLKGRGFWGSWGWGRRAFKGKREVSGGSYVFPSSMDREADNCIGEEETSTKEVNMTRVRRAGSFSSTVSNSRSQFWATICEGLKQVVPWRSRKLKKDGPMI